MQISGSAAPGVEGTPAHAVARAHLLTIALEDYYQVEAFKRLIQHGRWYRFESRVAAGARATLALLGESDVRATFFVSGWLAERVPEVVAEVAAAGHEIASSGYHHRRIRDLTPGEFRDDLAQAREALQRASGQRIVGYRVPRGWLQPADLWALDELAGAGYDYDSSVGCLLRAYAREPWRRFAHVHTGESGSIREFPPSAIRLLGLNVPVAGGNWFRQFPHTLMSRIVAHWDRTYDAPFVMYFHTWELDPNQPRITAAPLLQRMRHYRRLDRMGWILRSYLRRYRFGTIAGHIGVDTLLGGAAPPAPARVGVPAGPAAPPADAAAGRRGVAAPAARTRVSVVVPCYNEELILPYLANTLRSVEARLGGRYDLEFVFVDDGSSDGTWQALGTLFAELPSVQLVRHEVNSGVARAILTGVSAARSGIVCSIDCDCTYDPHELDRMIPLLAPGVALVTASPYHPRGAVRNVPGWRLALSRSLSKLYRAVLRNRLATYTSCFRVYRREAVLGIPVTRSGFLGVAELLGRMDLAGFRIAEYPTTLEVRMLGRSKMKIVRTMAGHLALLAELAWLRLSGGAAPARDPALPEPGGVAR